MLLQPQKIYKMKKMMMICFFLLGTTALCHAQGGMRMNPADRAKPIADTIKTE